MPLPKTHVQIWNIADRKLISNQGMSAWPKEPFRSLQLLADGKLLAVGWLPHRPPWQGMLRSPEAMHEPIPADWPATMPPLPDGIVRVWDTATGKETYLLKFPQHWDNSTHPPVCSPDGKLVATASFCDNRIRFWDLASGKEVGRFRCPVNGVETMVFSPDSRILAVSAKDTTVLLIDVAQVVGQ
jgi:WD40 repeat protein